MKFTLNQTWTLCLRMWRWIAKVWGTPRYRRYNVDELKTIWLKKNGLNRNWGCFFCEYNASDIGAKDCKTCPGALVDPDFRCWNDDYHYDDNPVGFYKELFRLNRIRRRSK